MEDVVCIKRPSTVCNIHGRAYTVYTINETYGYAWDHVCWYNQKAKRERVTTFTGRVTGPLGNGAYVIQYGARTHKGWNFYT